MNGWTYIAGWVLVHFVWQGAVVALVTAVLLQTFRQRSASARYLIACSGMSAMLFAAIITAVLIDPLPAAATIENVASRNTADSGARALLQIQIDDVSSPVQPWATRRIEDFLPWIVFAWMCGVAVLLARAAAGWWRVQCLHRRAMSSMRSSWQHAADRIAAVLGMARMTRVVELSGVDVPLVIGWLRPVIVLPIAAVSQLNAAQVEAILSHELAHVRRHDYLLNLMQTLAETLLFYHPAVWWLSSRVREEREHCCDDVAVGVCGDPVVYAAALAELESWRSTGLTLAAAATGGSLLNRVRRILSVEPSDDSRTPSWTIGLVAVALAGGLTFNIVAQTSSPTELKPKFEVASVRLNTSGANRVAMGMQPGGRFDAVNVPLALLIRSAYRLQESQLIGAPEWVATERYDVIAKAEREFEPPVPGGGLAPQQLMMQSLLEERFKLNARRETRQLPIYALVLAHGSRKLGPALKASDVDCQALAAARKQDAAPPPPPKPGEPPRCGTHMGFGRIAGGMPMTSLARLLSDVVQRSVVDMTGLTGNFDLELSWTPDQLPSRPAGTPADQPFRMNGVEIDPHGPSIFTAIQEQLGLKLESTRGAVDVLVVDHIERPMPD